MPEIFVTRPFILRDNEGRMRYFRPSSMRFVVTDDEARDPLLRECSIVIEERAPAAEPEPPPVKQRRNTRRGSTTSQ